MKSDGSFACLHARIVFSVSLLLLSTTDSEARHALGMKLLFLASLLLGGHDKERDGARRVMVSLFSVRRPVKVDSADYLG